jgi:multiple sugar transport system permease protein
VAPGSAGATGFQDIQPHRGRRWTSSTLTDGQFAYLFVLPVAIVLLLLVVYPLIDTFWISFRAINPVIQRDRFVGLAEYTRALSDPTVLHAIQITLIYAAVVTAVCSFVSIGSALLLNLEFVGKRILLIIVVLPWAMSTYATGVIWRYMYSPDFGFVDAVLSRLPWIHSAPSILNVSTALPAVAVAHAWQLAPIGTYFILATLQIIPQDLYRTARADGLGPIRRFWHVTLPYVRYSILIMLCIVTVEAARVFDIVYFMTGGGPGDATRMMSYEIYVQTFVTFDFGYGAAISYLWLIGITVLTLLYFYLLFGRERKAA